MAQICYEHSILNQDNFNHWMKQNKTDKPEGLLSAANQVVKYRKLAKDAIEHNKNYYQLLILFKIRVRKNINEMAQRVSNFVSTDTDM